MTTAAPEEEEEEEGQSKQKKASKRSGPEDVHMQKAWPEAACPRIILVQGQVRTAVAREKLQRCLAKMEFYLARKSVLKARRQLLDEQLKVAEAEREAEMAYYFRTFCGIDWARHGAGQ